MVDLAPPRMMTHQQVRIRDVNHQAKPTISVFKSTYLLSKFLNSLLRDA